VVHWRVEAAVGDEPVLVPPAVGRYQRADVMALADITYQSSGCIDGRLCAPAGRRLAMPGPRLCGGLASEYRSSYRPVVRLIGCHGSIGRAWCGGRTLAGQASGSLTGLMPPVIAAARQSRKAALAGIMVIGKPALHGQAGSLEPRGEEYEVVDR
jgi:hypothetical protein